MSTASACASARTWWPSPWQPQDWTPQLDAEAAALAADAHAPRYALQRLPVHRPVVLNALLDFPDPCSVRKAAIRDGLKSIWYFSRDPQACEHRFANIARASFLTTPQLIKAVKDGQVARGHATACVRALSAHRRFTRRVAGALVDAAYGGQDRNTSVATREEVLDALAQLPGWAPFADALRAGHRWSQAGNRMLKLEQLAEYLEDADDRELAMTTRLLLTSGHGFTDPLRLALAATRRWPRRMARSEKARRLIGRGHLPRGHEVRVEELDAVIHAALAAVAMPAAAGAKALRELPVHEERVWTALASAPRRPRWVSEHLCVVASNVYTMVCSDERAVRDVGEFEFRLPRAQRMARLAEVILAGKLPPVMSRSVWHAFGRSSGDDADGLAVVAAAGAVEPAVHALCGMAHVAWRRQPALKGVLAQEQMPGWVTAMAKVVLVDEPAPIPGEQVPHGLHVAGIPLPQFVTELGPLAARSQAWELVESLVGACPGEQIAPAVKAALTAS